MRKYPHMPQFVSDNRTQILLIEYIEEGLFKRYFKDALFSGYGLHGNNQIIPWDNHGSNLFRNPHFLLQVIDDALDSLRVVFGSAAAARRVRLNDENQGQGDPHAKSPATPPIRCCHVQTSSQT